MSEGEVVYFGVLFGVLILWTSLGVWLFRLLRKHHPAAFEAIGSPSLFLNNSPRNGWLTMKFLLTGAYRSLNDDRISRICRLMRIVFALYLVWFLLPFLWLLIGR